MLESTEKNIADKNITDISKTAVIENSISYNQLSGELLRALRGDLSQRQLSQMLGYSYNQVGKWESGFKQFKWSDFFNLSKVLNIPWEEKFRYYFWTFQGEFTPISILEELIGQLTFQNTSLTKKHKTVLKKWKNGESDPDFTEVLELIDAFPSVLLNFISFFTGEKILNSLESRHKIFRMSLELVQNEPLCIFINAALQLQEYKNLSVHSDLVLASQCHTNVENLKRVLGLMTWHQLVQYDGRKYQALNFDFSFSGLRLEKLRSFTKYVTQLAADKYPLHPRMDGISLETENSCVSSVRVNAMSKEAAQKVMNLVSNFHHLVSQVMREDCHMPKDNVQVLLIHSFHAKV